METFEIGWADNVKARIISEKQDNAYRRDDKPEVRSQLAIYDYYLHKEKETNE